MRKSLLDGLKPMHPGELLREEILPAVALPRTEVARRLGISRAMLYAILEERVPVSTAMALRFGKLFGNDPAFWLSLQQRYDIWRLSSEMAEELQRIETVGVSDAA